MATGNGIGGQSGPISRLGQERSSGMGREIAKSRPQRNVMGACSPQGPYVSSAGEMDRAVGRSIISIANIPIRGPWNLRLSSGCSWGDIRGVIGGLFVVRAQK